MSIGSGNGLAPHRQQAITWTNADPVHWRLYAALGEGELNGEVLLLKQRISIVNRGATDLRSIWYVFSYKTWMLIFIWNNEPSVAMRYAWQFISFVFVSCVLMLYGNMNVDYQSFRYWLIAFSTPAETRWPPFSRRHFQMHFLEWKCINFD